MSRASAIAIVVLGSLALVEGAMLMHRPAVQADAAARTDAASQAGSMVGAASSDAVADPALQAVLGRLTAIDARLAALEHAGGRTTVAASAKTQIDAPDPAGFADADRRLSTLLPGRVLGHEDVARFQMTIAALPADQQLALSAAFARAVNEDRIRLRF
jgi:hypothetical protein